ncbi:protein RETICULATA-RELATED 3 [Forsythia ovata]|uniref:Protein RETICULATA-RELATED 3 n=1 Tax=Forsythia ovata TaxID=205694 RepID=A0ABD1TB68_9LAMI
MTTMTQLRYSPLAGHYRQFTSTREISNFTCKFADNTSPNGLSVCLLKCTETKRLNPDLVPNFHIPCAGGGGDIGFRGGSGGGDGGSGGWADGGGDSDESKPSWDGFGPIGAFLNGWRSRVAADPQFAFKVLMEELVGVTACVIGDMASRPNFGLNELDFVFSTLVVGSILNFVLMYLLAPTMSSSSASLPAIFASCPPSHMFEPGPYGLLNRLGTFVYKGTLFAAVGFAAGTCWNCYFEWFDKGEEEDGSKLRDTKQASTNSFECCYLGNSHGPQQLTGSQSVMEEKAGTIDDGSVEEKQKLVN